MNAPPLPTGFALEPFEHAFESVVYLDRFGLLRWVNRAAERLFGLPPDQLTSHTWAEVTEPAGEEMAARLKTALTEQGLWEGSVWIRTADGIPRVVLGRCVVQGDGRLWFLTPPSTDERLLASETMHRTAAEMAGVGIFRWELGTSIMRSTAVGLKLFGLANHLDPPIQTIARLIQPVDRRELFRSIRNASRAYVEIVREFRVRRSNGQTVWLELRGRLLPGRGGHPTLVGTVFEITQRKAVERALKTAEETIPLILANISDAFLTLDREFRIIFLNGQAENLLRTARRDCTGQVLTDVAPAFAGTGFESAYQRAFLTQEKQEAELYFPSHEAWFRIHAQPTLHGVTIYAHDVTHRHQMAEALQRSEAHLRRLSDGVPHMMFSANPDGELDYVNAAWTRYFGFGLEGLGGARYWELFHPEDVRHVQEEWERSLASGAPFECEYRIQRSDGVHRWHLARAEAIRNSEGRVVKWFGTIIDIHALKETEQELEARVEQRTRQLADAIREMEAFTYSVSHDLRSPLRSISMNCQFMMEDYGEQLPEGAIELIDRLRYQAKKCGSLIDALLGLSRLGRADLVWREVDLSQLAHEFERDLIVRDKRPKVRFEIEEELLMPGDPRLLQQVLANLLENAVKFSPEGGTIRVGRSPDGAVFVKDEGVGFDATYVGRIFKPFERLHREEEFPGTGIGLATVQRIMERHQGRVWAEAELGKGATFFFITGEEPSPEDRPSRRPR